MYVIGFYELDREYGGPEEGGWWYDTGELVRPFAIVRNYDQANAKCRRANKLLDHIQRHKRSTGSVAYRGGRYAAMVFEDNLPKHHPQERPHYE
jgi:hypothetical protein